MKAKRLINLAISTLLCVTIIGSSAPIRATSVYAASYGDELTTGEGGDDVVSDPESTNINGTDINSSAGADVSIGAGEASSSSESGEGTSNTSDSADSASSVDATNAADSDNSASTEASEVSNTSSSEASVSGDNGEANSSNSSSESSSNESGSSDSDSSDESDSANSADSTSASNEADTADNSDNANTGASDDSSAADNAGSGSGTETPENEANPEDLASDALDLNDDDASNGDADVHGEEIYVTPNLNSIIDRVEVILNGTTLENGDKNNVIGDSDSYNLKFKYYFKNPIAVNIPANEAEDRGYTTSDTPCIATGQEFTVSADNSIFNEVGSIQIGTIQADGVDFADVAMATDKITITVLDQPMREVENGFFEYDVTLNKGSKKVADQEYFELTINNEKYKISLDEYKKNPPTVTTSGVYNREKNEIEWTVKIENATQRPETYDEGYILSGVLSSGQDYIEGSMKFADDTAATPTVNGTDITVSLTKDQAATNNTITFLTKPTVDFMKESFKANKGGENNKTFTLNANINEGDTTNPISTAAPATVSVSETFAQWITKAGGTIDENGEATWEVTINTNGYKIKNLMLYDKYDTDFVDGETRAKMVLVGDPGIEGATGTLLDGDENSDFRISFGDVDGASVSTIKVTYTTKIENYDDFLSENHKIPNNKAWVSYDEGTGTGVSTIKVDCALKGITNTRAGISKDFVEEDTTGENPRLVWTVTANANKKALKNSVISEKIVTTRGPHKLIAIKDITLSNGTTIPDIDATDDTSYELDLGDQLNGESVTFKVVTEVTDRTIWSTNVTKTFVNNVELSCEANGNTIKAKDSASHTITNPFLKLESGAFDYNTHLIDYTLTITGGKTAISGVVATDELSKLGVEFFTDDTHKLMVNGAEYTNYTYQNGVLTISGLDFANTDSVKKITFTGKVTDDKITEIQKSSNGSGTIKNTVSVKTDDHAKDQTQTAECSNTIKVNALSKNGQITDGMANFTVKLNGGKQLFPAGTVIKDTLGKVYYLDQTSVYLYKATVDSTGVPQKDASSTKIAVNVSVKELEDYRTELSVELKEATNEAMVLEYSASPAYKDVYKDAADYENSVVITGKTTVESSANFRSFSKSSNWGASSRNLRTFTLVVSDDDDTSVKLPGVTYEVFEKGTDKSKGEMTTQNGGIKKNFKLENGEYYLVQKTKPDGYLLNPYKQPLTIDGDNVKLELTLLKEDSGSSYTDPANPDPTNPSPSGDPANPDPINPNPSGDPAPTDPVTPGTSGEPNEPETPQNNTDPNGGENNKPAEKDPAESNNAEKPSDEKPKTEDDKKDEGNKPVPSGSDESGTKPADPGTPADEGKDLTQNTKDSDSDNSDKNKDDKSKKKKDDSKQKKDESKEKKDESKDSKSGDNTDNDQNTSGNNSEGATTDANGSSSDDSNASGSTSNGTTDATNSTDAALNKENGDLANADAANATNEAGDELGTRKKLAKTGGFFGTLYGYLAGLLMIIAGAVITFKKRKKN